MKTPCRKTFMLKGSLYFIICICWFEMLMHSCISAKSYYKRIGSDLPPLYNPNEKIPPFPDSHSDTWQPRKKYFNEISPQFLQYQSVLVNKISPREIKNAKSVILPQIDPVDGCLLYTSDAADE